MLLLPAPHAAPTSHSWVEKRGGSPGPPEPPKCPPGGGLASRPSTRAAWLCVFSACDFPLTFREWPRRGANNTTDRQRREAPIHRNTAEAPLSLWGEAVYYSPVNSTSRLYRCGGGPGELHVRRACPRSVWPRPPSQPVAPMPAPADPKPVHVGPSGATGVRVQAQGNVHLFSLPHPGSPGCPDLVVWVYTWDWAHTLEPRAPVGPASMRANFIPLQACVLRSVPPV